MRSFKITGGLRVLAGVLALLATVTALAHGVADRDAAYLQENAGRALPVFTYLGAKHMVTGYDHLLYLLGVIFFLYRMKDVAIYVTMFAVGHSITLLAGVLGELHINPYLVDAVIGLSIVYKAFENLGGFQSTLGWAPNPKLAVLFFGLIHGFGLATKLQDFSLSPDGLVANIIAFNVGVELGQLLALSILVFFVVAWRATRGFDRYANAFNVALMFAGFTLAAYQLAGYAIGAA